MGLFIMIIGFVLIFIYWVKRFVRTQKQGISFFSGALFEEAIFQWIGIILVFIGVALL